MPKKIIEPTKPDPATHAGEILRSGGWPDSEIAWLVPEFLAAFGEEDGSEGSLLDHRTEHALQVLAASRKQIGDSAAALIFATRSFEEEFTPPVVATRWNVVLLRAGTEGLRLAKGFGVLHAYAGREARVDQFFTWPDPGSDNLRDRLWSLGQRIAGCGVIDFVDCLDAAKIERDCSGEPWCLTKWPDEARSTAQNDPSTLSFWFHALGDPVLTRMTDSILAEAPPEKLLRKTEVLVRDFSEWMTSYSSRGLKLASFDYMSLSEVIRHDLERLYFAVESIRTSATVDWSLAVPLSMHLARMAFEHRSAHLSETARRAILKLASDAVAKMRPALRKANTPEGVAEFTSHPTNSLFNDSVFMLFEVGSLWEAWKPLLLAFRALSAPALAPNLSFVDGAPAPWSTIPSSIVMMFHHRARKEEEFDETLRSLRSSFGQFCLDSLKTKNHSKGKDGKTKVEVPFEFREPDATWRYCYVRALEELRINPGGDGHHVLNFTLKHDESEMVREAAKKAYNEVRRGDRLGDMSPRRAILQAFWWLEQAHMLALNQDVAEAGAQRTRAWLIRHTKEKKKEQS